MSRSFAPWGWVIGTGVYVDDLRAAQRDVLLKGGLTAGFVAVMVGLLTWMVGRGITRPLARITAATGAMAAGDLDTPVPGTARRDELGLLSRVLETFREAGLRTRRLEAEAAAVVIDPSPMLSGRGRPGGRPSGRTPSARKRA